MNFRLFEFEDKAWLPNTVREGMTDYLRFILNIGNFYEPVTPLIIQLLKRTGSIGVVDLCSGGGGTVEQIQKNIKIQCHQHVPFVMTDKFPNLNAYKFIQQKTMGKITYFSGSVNAMQVDDSLNGVRTIFSAFHHFDNDTAKQVIGNAVTAREGIAVFDGGDKNIFFILFITLLHPIAFFLLTPFLRPFKWSRLLLTYIIPVIPLCTVWDGIASVVRLYTPEKLLMIAKSVDNTNYCWEAGKQKNKFGMHITYLIGYPISKNINFRQEALLKSCR